MTEKEQITQFRSRYVTNNNIDECKLRKLEAKYGKYIYLPLDIPKVLPDPVKFKAWFFENSKPIQKIADDVAGGLGSRPQFRSIETTNTQNKIWERNERDDIVQTFPEIREMLLAMPFQTQPRFMLWSSMYKIPAHRDQGPWLDLPSSFRIMLYDENPEPTLELRECPTQAELTMHRYYPLRKLPNVQQTPAFAWNNLRSKHSSSFNGSAIKILLIVSQVQFDFEKYEDLMERSIAKYSQYAMLSTSSLSDFAFH